MNSFGRIFRISIFGESHGESVGIVIDGCPAGLPLTVEDFLPDLERRKGGTQKGTTPRQEEDLPSFKSGIFIILQPVLRLLSCWRIKIPGVATMKS
jgi:chorismate synthase